MESSPTGRGRSSWPSEAGKVIGSRPEGLTLPVRILASASPPRWPGYQAWTIAGTASAQGISTGPPVSSTATVLGCAAATAAISASWWLGRRMSGTSSASVVHCVANTIARSASFAASTVALRLRPST